MQITQDGVYEDVPEDAYHTDRAISFGPTLSASGAKVLLKSPAQFAYERENGSNGTKSMDLGTLVHTLVLGVGVELVVIDCDNWMSPKNRALRDEALAAGKWAVNRTEIAKAEAMAESIRSHPTAGPLFIDGLPEVTLYWTDPETGVRMRARLDYLLPDRIVDLKTTSDGSPEGFAKSCAKYGYRESAANYIEGHRVLLGFAPEFLLVTVESNEPYRVRVWRFGVADLEVGANRMAEARRLFAKHEAEGYPQLDLGVTEIIMPAWANEMIPLGTLEDDAAPESRF
jgi:hypothetical protein